MSPYVVDHSLFFEGGVYAVIRIVMLMMLRSTIWLKLCGRVFAVETFERSVQADDMSNMFMIQFFYGFQRVVCINKLD